MMKRIALIASVFALFSPGCPWAQDLHKDITVEQAVTPAKREASRITVLPTVQLTPVKAASLNYSSKVVTTNVPNTFTTLDPVAWGDKLYTSPYRGYFDLGIGMPVYLGGVSAGYRMVDNDRTRLSAWGQYNGDVYKREKVTWHDHTASLGLDLHQTIGSRSTLDGGVNYTYGFHDMPGDLGRFSQSTSRINASVLFSSSHSGLSYNAGLKYQHFGFYNPHIPGVDQSTLPDILNDPYNGYEPVRQNLIGLSLAGRIETGASSHAGIDIDANLLATGKYYEASIPYFEDEDMIPMRSRKTALVTLNPYFETHSQSATLRIGAEVDFSKNSGKAFHIAPDVTLAWHGSQIFGIELRGHGGSQMNSLASLYDISPYMNGSIAYRHSHIPYALDAKIAFGPFFGGSIELFGGYARANDWLMPVVNSIYPAGAVWQPVDICGYHYGVKIGYDNGKNLAVSVKYEGAPGKWDRAYYEWRDRARHVINAELKVRPVEKLLITAGYEFRAGRSCYAYTEEPTMICDLEMWTPERVSMGVVGNLSVGAGYSFTDRLTLFARGENLLGRKCVYIGGRPMQSANVMIGAALKF